VVSLGQSIAQATAYLTMLSFHCGCVGALSFKKKLICLEVAGGLTTILTYDGR
jgi:hypothetical protein